MSSVLQRQEADIELLNLALGVALRRHERDALTIRLLRDTLASIRTVSGLTFLQRELVNSALSKTAP